MLETRKTICQTEESLKNVFKSPSIKSLSQIPMQPFNTLQSWFLGLDYYTTPNLLPADRSEGVWLEHTAGLSAGVCVDVVPVSHDRRWELKAENAKRHSHIWIWCAHMCVHAYSNYHQFVLLLQHCLHLDVNFAVTQLFLFFLYMFTIKFCLNTLCCFRQSSKYAQIRHHHFCFCNFITLCFAFIYFFSL